MPTPEMIRACTIAELAAKGHIIVHADGRQVVLFHNHGTPAAVDDRCPHMGFPLHRGTCRDGVVTCHWHHARFDAASGGTFDFFAGDVDPYDVEIRGEDIYVSKQPRPRDERAYRRRQLREGLERDSHLAIAKALLALRDAKVDVAEILREAATFALTNRDTFGPGLTILTAMANLLPHVQPETAYFALYQGLAQTADSVAGQAQHRKRYPLEASKASYESLVRLLKYWTLAHHRDGAERTLLTAVHAQLPQRDLARLLFTAATERFYMDGGHTLDFCNKASELLDLIGWDENAAEALASLAPGLTSGRGQEELDAWRQPIDLVPLVRAAAERLPHALNAGGVKTWTDESRLAENILGEDPAAILDAIVKSAEAGARPAQLAKSLAYAAVVRIARFATSNELGDWITALHTFTYCNAMHAALTRCPDDVVFARGVLHGAMSVYQDRFLNVPPARLPGERQGEKLDDLPQSADELLALFLKTLDTQSQVTAAARIVARYLSHNHDVEKLIDTMTFAVVREDADFHTFQMLEAGVRQFFEWGPGTIEGRTILIAVARFIAAHSPTQRADLQTARIALRLHRGEAIYESED
jgi:nitrite reductase/ring-hydroxylating ferredoxin subunit